MLKNIITAFFSRGAVALSNFALLLLTAHYLGSEVVGQVSLLILNIAIVQTINETYTGTALVYFVPGSAMMQIYRQGALFVLLVTVLFCAGFALFGAGQVNLIVHLFFLSILYTFNAFHNALLLAREKIRAYNILVFLQPFLMLVTLLFQVVVFRHRSFDAYILALYLASGTTLLLSALFLFPLFTGGGSPVNFWHVLRNGVMNQLGNLAHTLSNRLNYYLLGSAALVGVYASSTSLIEAIWIISGSVSPIVLSHVANRKEDAGNARLTLLLARLCFLLGIICVLILFFVPSGLFVFLLGQDFTQVKTVMLYLSPGVVCLSFSSILSHYFSGLGQQKTLLLANVCGLLVTVSTAWVLIARFGLIGACYSASLAYFVQALILTLVFLKQNKIGLKEIFHPKIDATLLK